MTCQLQAGVVPKCGQKLTALGTFMGGAAAATSKRWNWAFWYLSFVGDSLRGSDLERVCVGGRNGDSQIVQKRAGGSN